MAELDTIRLARVDDAARIVQLIRDGFEPRLLEAFIYGYRGIETYVAMQIDAAELAGDTRFLVTEAAGTVAACIEIRLLADRLFLNYVTVDRRARKRRCATRLLAAAIAALARPHHDSLSLDVLEGNARAQAWYAALGMSQQSTTCWYVLPPPDPGDGVSEAIVSGSVQARLCHRVLGFSQLSIVCSCGTYDVGMLGERWFRITSARALRDRSLLAALSRIDPSRSILALLPSTEPPPEGATEFARTVRRTATLAALRERLERS